MTGRRVRAAAAVVALAALGLGGWQAVSWWRFGSMLARARELMNENRFAEARGLLVGLPAGRSADPEAAYRLGVCEHAAGDVPAALAVWSRIDPGTNWGMQAGLARARTLAGGLGKFAEAEAVLRSLLNGRGELQDEARHTLSEVLFWEGRRDEVRALVEAAWRNTTTPVVDLTDHWKVESVTMIEFVRVEVERAAGLAPEDDRVWLARANLAAQAGRFDEAASWLDRCAARRPDDPAVWRARYELARVRGDAGGVLRAAGRLPASRFTEPERLELAAWLASRRGDAGAERRALERLVAVAPGDTRALDRLASLAWDAGDRDRAKDFRRRKAELDATKDKYRGLIDGSITPAKFAELGALAEALGRRFEARGWWLLRAAYAPYDRTARLASSRLAEPAGSAPPRPARRSPRRSPNRGRRKAPSPSPPTRPRRSRPGW